MPMFPEHSLVKIDLHFQQAKRNRGGVRNLEQELTTLSCRPQQFWKMHALFMELKTGHGRLSFFGRKSTGHPSLSLSSWVKVTQLHHQAVHALIQIPVIKNCHLLSKCLPQNFSCC